jgi:hypothetical protein
LTTKLSPQQATLPLLSITAWDPTLQSPASPCNILTSFVASITCNISTLFIAPAAWDSTLQSPAYPFTHFTTTHAVGTLAFLPTASFTYSPGALLPTAYFTPAFGTLAFLLTASFLTPAAGTLAFLPTANFIPSNSNSDDCSLHPVLPTLKKPPDKGFHTNLPNLLVRCQGRTQPSSESDRTYYIVRESLGDSFPAPFWLEYEDSHRSESDRTYYIVRLELPRDGRRQARVAKRTVRSNTLAERTVQDRQAVHSSTPAKRERTTEYERKDSHRQARVAERTLRSNTPAERTVQDRQARVANVVTERTVRSNTPAPFWLTNLGVVKPIPGGFHRTQSTATSWLHVTC